ncbi:CDP-alcohol phosphatidyltransferase family protein [Candidatus Uhrbacteria bacterium]|nr:CDP-alcohol phosphatidyltransferase family protein [Candidatus Uhrbacteria bacterium]
MKLPSFHDTKYIKAEKVLFTDRLIMASGARYIPAWITPNHITLLRILFAPVAILLLIYENYQWGVPLFFFVALTDAVDGALARTRNMITEWGMMYDPLADKLLIIPTLLFLIFKELHPFIGGAVVSIECFIIFLALGWRNSGQEIKANIWGKWKMVFQVAGCLALLLAVWLSLPLHLTASILLSVSIFFACMSIFRYGI